MSNPFLVQVPFAYQGNKNTIQLERQQSQDEEDATYKAGFPPVTMAKEELGGKPPKGLDFNGIFYELSSPIAHYCKGGRIYFDQEYANAINGYPKGHIVASNDSSKDFVSLIDGNTLNPNSNSITGYWSIYSGQGSIPTASSTISGTVKLVNNLTSGGIDRAVTAEAMKLFYEMHDGSDSMMNIPCSSRPNQPWIIQFLDVEHNPNGNTEVKWNKPFPNVCLYVFATPFNSTASYATVFNFSKDGLTMNNWVERGVRAPIKARVLLAGIGY